MPPRAARLTMGPWLRGLNQVKAPTLLAPDEAASLYGVDLTGGTLAGLYGPNGLDTATLADATAGWIHYADGAGWFFHKYPQFACDDTVNPGTGGRWCFMTDKDASGNPLQAKMLTGSSSRTLLPLGISAPSAPTIGGSGTGGSQRAFRVTYVVALSGIDRTGSDFYAHGATYESNPSTQVTMVSGWSSLTINIPAPPVGLGVTEARVYATAPGTTTGPFYYLGVYGTFGSAIALSTSSPTVTYLLNWDAGGGPANPIYKYDHSPAPSLTCLSTTMHSLVESTGGGSAWVPPASGILMGGAGSTFCWSAAGYPWYWPQANRLRLDAVMEGIVTDQAIASVVTRASVYVVNGTDDQNLSIVRSTCPYGCSPGNGMAVALSPFGVLFPAQSGVVLFDGNQGRVVSSHILLGLGLADSYIAVFDDDYYILQAYDSNAIYLFDFSTWPELRLTRGPNNLEISTMTKTSLSPTSNGVGPGVYVELADGSGHVQYWRPRLREAIGGAQPQPWEWTSGRLTLDAPTLPKRFCRLWLNASGTVSIHAVAGFNSGAPATTFDLTASDWLPDTFESVDWLQLIISSSDGTGVVYGVDVETEVCNEF